MRAFDEVTLGLLSGAIVCMGSDLISQRMLGFGGRRATSPRSSGAAESPAEVF
jgi:hypothetical protein